MLRGPACCLVIVDLDSDHIDDCGWGVCEPVQELLLKIFKEEQEV